jgi:fatty acid desaturase
VTTSTADSSPKRQRGLLRYDADWVSIIWIQATLVVSLLPWFVDMPVWARVLLAVPVFMLRSSCAYVQHNQGHLPVFWNKGLNFLYDIEITLMTGYVTPLWELQHSRGHHRLYLEPGKDPASIIDPKTGKPMSRVAYCFWGNLTIIQDSWRIAKLEVKENRADLRPRMVAEFILAGLLAGVLLYANWFHFLCYILIPNVIVAWGVWHISYDHHYELPGTTHYNGSHSHFGTSFNRSTFNIGHHAAHHEKPTLHWSLLPQRSAQILPKLDPKSVHGQLEPEVQSLVPGGLPEMS